jgi:hypothetical protein
MHFDVVFSGVGQSSVRNVRGMLPSPYKRRESPPKEAGSPSREKRSPVARRNCRSGPGQAVKSETLGAASELRAIGNRLSTVRGTKTISIPESI